MNETHLRAVFLVRAGKSVVAISEEFKLIQKTYASSVRRL
jgi:predicted NodU family carbamoyl transferase